MALKKTIIKEVYGQRVSIKNAYHRVEKIEGNKDGLTFILSSYTEDLEHQVSSDFFCFKPSSDENSSRWDKQCYEYIKSLDDFSGALDI